MLASIGPFLCMRCTQHIEDYQNVQSCGKGFEVGVISTSISQAQSSRVDEVGDPLSM